MDTLRNGRVEPRAFASLPVCAALLLAAGAVHAQTAAPEDVAAARSLGVDGTRLADSGDCNGAIPKLEAAEKLFHAPTTLDRLGECEINVGHLVAGTEDLNRVVREQLAPSAPAAFIAAKKRAQVALAAAQPRIGNLRIHVDGAPADKITLTVDGVAVSSAILDADRPTDPGSHEVSASAPGYRTVTTTVSVRESAESAASLRLEVDPTAVAATPAPGTAPATGVTATATVSPATGAEPHGANHTPAIAAFTIGGVGLVVGTVFGILALGTKSTLNGECTNKTCPASAQSDVNSLSTKATVSTIGFGVGIAGVAVGAILLAVSHPSEGAGSASAIETPRPSWSPWIGVGSAGVEGSFQ